jgi:hypothetical protein
MGGKFAGPGGNGTPIHVSLQISWFDFAELAEGRQ